MTEQRRKTACEHHFIRIWQAMHRNRTARTNFTISTRANGQHERPDGNEAQRGLLALGGPILYLEHTAASGLL